MRSGGDVGKGFSADIGVPTSAGVIGVPYAFDGVVAILTGDDAI